MAQELAKINSYPHIQYLAASSYGQGTTSSGKVKLSGLKELDIKDRDVVLIDDILETGQTLDKVKQKLLERGARSIIICVLLQKPGQNHTKIKADIIGFDIKNEFVVGYGLDYGGRYRELPYVGVLRD